MPGVNLNLDLPAVDDTLETIVTKTADALSAISADLAPRVTPSALSIDADLSMNGYALLNAGGVTLSSGTSEDAGSLYYYTDGEFYLRTGDGAIRVTHDGALDFVADNGFTGDYGNGTETAAYSNAAGEFRFLEDSAVWADLVCDDVVLEGQHGSVRFGTPSTISSAAQMQFSSLPSGGISALEYDGGDYGVKDNNATRATNLVQVTDIDVSGSIIHGDRTITTDLLTYIIEDLGGGISTTRPASPLYVSLLSGDTSDPTHVARVQLALSVPIGGRLKSVGLTSNGGATWTTSNIEVYRHNVFPCSSSAIAGSVSSVSGGAGIYAATLFTFTVTSPTALTSGQKLYLRLSYPSGTDPLVWISYTYDKTA